MDNPTLAVPRHHSFSPGLILDEFRPFHIVKEERRMRRWSLIDLTKLQAIACLRDTEESITVAERLARIHKRGYIAVDARVLLALKESEFVPQFDFCHSAPLRLSPLMYIRKKFRVDEINFPGTILHLRNSRVYSILSMRWNEKRWIIERRLFSDMLTKEQLSLVLPP